MLDAATIDSELDAEAARYLARTTNSYAQMQLQARALPLGVASSFQSHYPYPFVVDYGEGAWVWDIDGNRYLDVHGGFGVNVLGHSHPAVVEAIEAASNRGLHFATPHRELAEYALTLQQRFRLERLRLSPSGTEATMDALRFARAATGRDLVVKIEGAYHGHHDVALTSTKPDPAEAGWPPRPVPASDGILPAVIASLRVVALNNHQQVTELFEREGERIAAVIIEPILCNLGFTRASEEYLQLLRELCTEHGSVYIWDEVKTGATVAYRGMQSLVDVRPDLLCLGKAIGGGAPIGAVGGLASIMEVVEKNTPHYGTFAGNPLAVAAGQAALNLLTPEAYDRLNGQRERLQTHIRRDIETYNLPLHVDGEGAKGGIFCAPQPARDYREWLEETDARLAQWGWIFLANRGVWGAPGADEQWTLSLAMGDDEISWYLQAWDAWIARMLEIG
jgi:glutamate-1-semialdehyde 2,1-aminomutase